MNIYEMIYRDLEALGAFRVFEISSDGTARSKSKGFMDLVCEDYGVVEKGGRQIVLGHYYVQNGDLMSDPSMTIRIFPDARMAEAMTFEQHGVEAVYQEVYPEPGKVYLKRKKELNAFLRTWLRNCRAQGHLLVPQAKAA